jgi:hypothetical protein
MEYRSDSEVSSVHSEESQSDTPSYNSETSESYISDSEASITLGSSSESDVDGNLESRDAGPRTSSRRGIQQDQVSATGVDKSQPKDPSEEASEESEAGSSGQKKASKRGAVSEESSGAEEEDFDEVYNYKDPQEKVDLLCRWRWDDFKDREPKAEVLSDCVWVDFIPSPTTFEYSIRTKESIPKVRIPHSEEGASFFIGPLCYWAITSYAMSSLQSCSISRLRGLYNEIFFFLGNQPDEAFSGSIYIQAMRQKDLFGPYLEGDSEGMPLGGDAGGLKAVWLDFLQKRKVLISRNLLRNISNMIGIRFTAGGETTSFYNFMRYHYSQKQHQHSIAGAHCSYCSFCDIIS